MKSLIDAALASPVATFPNKAWFFKGSSYIRYHFNSDKADPGFPQPSGAWGPPVASGVDAACNGQLGFAGKSYFFKGGQYFRFDWPSDAFDQPGKPLSAWGLTGGFANAIDAALDDKLDCHDDAGLNASTQQFVRDEVAAVCPGFMPTAAPPDGIA